MTRAMPRTSFRLIAAAILAVALLSGCTTIKNVFDGRGKDRSKDPTKLAQITPSATVNKLWSTSVGKGDAALGVAQRPAIVDGHVYAAAVEGGVSAFDLHSGQSLWRYASELSLTGGPGAGDGLVVVGDFEGVLHWLRLNDGAFAARSNLSGAITGQPAVADNILVVQTIDGQLAAFALQ